MSSSPPLSCSTILSISTSFPFLSTFCLLHLKMRRLFLIVLYFISGAGSAQQSSLLDLYFTKRPPDSYLVFCTPQIPEEWVTQLHWKEEHANGTYSVMAVLNTHWGNYTKFPYQEAVKLHIKDGKTYMMEIAALEIYVCCEVVTFPSGSILENCITIEEKSDMYNLRYAILGTSVVGGFFILGSLVLICHICWMRKNTSRVFNVRGPRQQVWTRRRGSNVPYRRTLPSMNLAYEPPHDTDLQNDTPLPARAHLLLPHLTSQPPAEGLPPRNPSLNSHWPSEELSLINPTPLSVLPLRNHAAQEVLPTPQQIYSNIHHRNKQYPKAHHGKSLQIAPTINHNHPEMFSYESTDTSSTVPYYHPKSHPWLFEGTSCSSEDTVSQHSSRINTPRPPDSPFITINPMYHSGTGWTSHPKNGHLKYEHSLSS